MEITRFTLPNGLRVVHNHDRSTAMAAVNLLYDVGARDEDPQHTGMAHLFEHLMFSGSENIADFDRELQLAGGMSNAWTSNDFTNFYDILPAHNIETAFHLESDRMLALTLSQKALDVQKSVVIEEFKQQCLNQPYGDMGHLLRKLNYRRHPYRWPVIGLDFDHIASVTLDDARRFYQTHYSPHRTIMTISGNVDTDTVRRLCDKWFATIPSRETPLRDIPSEPLRDTPETLEAEGNVPLTAITLSYPMDPYGTEGYFAADLLTDILANGTSSRFYRNLAMDTGIFADVDACILGSEHEGLLMFNARLARSGKDEERRAIDAIDSQIEKVLAGDISAHEITRAVNRMESAAMFANLNYLAKAQTMATAEYHGVHPDDLIAPYRQLTPEKVTEAARRMIADQRRTTLIYRPA